MKTVRIPGIKEYTSNGRRYRYHRLSRTPIDSSLSGLALAAEIDRLDRLHKPLQPVAGTLRGVVMAYREKSEHWARLRPRTRVDYERVFRWLGKAMDEPVIRFRPTTIVGLRDKAKRQHSYKFANQLLVVLRAIFSYAVEYGLADANPTRDVAQSARPEGLPEANRPWTPAEAVAMLDGVPKILRGPVALAAYLGLREGDVLALSRRAYADGMIKLTTSKTRRSLELPVCADLATILAEAQAERTAFCKRKKRSDDATTLFVTSRGRPWTSDGFKTSFGRARDALLKAEVIAPGLTFHGARHGVATLLADEGFEASQTKHLLGHGAETMTEHYSRRAKRRKPLLDMAETIERCYRAARGNVVDLAAARGQNL